jgi:hypothetical protein
MNEVTIDVEYTLSDIAWMFEHAEEVLGPELFQLWVDDFWSDFSANGGKL